MFLLIELFFLKLNDGLLLLFLFDWLLIGVLKVKVGVFVFVLFEKLDRIVEESNINVGSWVVFFDLVLFLWFWFVLFLKVIEIEGLDCLFVLEFIELLGFNLNVDIELEFVVVEFFILNLKGEEEKVCFSFILNLFFVFVFGLVLGFGVW